MNKILKFHHYHLSKPVVELLNLKFSSFKFQVLFVTYTTIQRVYNQQWNVSQVPSMDSANIVEYNTREVYIK